MYFTGGGRGKDTPKSSVLMLMLFIGVEMIRPAAGGTGPTCHYVCDTAKPCITEGMDANKKIPTEVPCNDETGWCYERRQGGKLVERSCLTEDKWNAICAVKLLGNCIVTDVDKRIRVLTSGKPSGEDWYKCIEENGAPKQRSQTKRRPKGRATDDENISSTCFCKDDRCNENIPVPDTGKQILKPKRTHQNEDDGGSMNTINKLSFLVILLVGVYLSGGSSWSW